MFITPKPGGPQTRPCGLVWRRAWNANMDRRGARFREMRTLTVQWGRPGTPVETVSLTPLPPGNVHSRCACFVTKMLRGAGGKKRPPAFVCPDREKSRGPGPFRVRVRVRGLFAARTKKTRAPRQARRASPPHRGSGRPGREGQAGDLGLAVQPLAGLCARGRGRTSAGLPAGCGGRRAHPEGKWGRERERETERMGKSGPKKTWIAPEFSVAEEIERAGVE